MTIILNDILDVSYIDTNAVIASASGEFYVAYDPEKRALNKTCITLKLTLTKNNKLCLYVK